MRNLPRIMLAAAASGGGKTTLTLAILAALQAEGYHPAACKCGPDYIDPMFHQEVLGLPSYNLDLFLADKQTVRGLLCAHGQNHDLTLIEGVMGYYDGLGMTSRAGSYDLAHTTATPVLLVLSAKGAALSLAALAQGLINFRRPSQIVGLLLNDCGEALYQRLKPLLEEECGLPVLGYLPHLADCEIGSRHLGLVTAAEISDLQSRIARLGEAARQSIDLGALMDLAMRAPPLEESLPPICRVCEHSPRIAVAMDKAFCFYYADNLRLLEKLGAELVRFSPLNDQALPEQLGGLYLGGGYPELYAPALSENRSMRQSLKEAIGRGLPTLAECGGFMYLQEKLGDYDMVGALPGQAFDTGRLQRFGYITLSSRQDNLLCRAGETMAAHEFHYWDSSQPGDSCLAQKPDGRAWPAVVATDTLFAGFPHLYFYGNTKSAATFVSKAAAFGGII